MFYFHLPRIGEQDPTPSSNLRMPRFVLRFAGGPFLNFPLGNLLERQHKRSTVSCTCRCSEPSICPLKITSTTKIRGMGMVEPNHKKRKQSFETGSTCTRTPGAAALCTSAISLAPPRRDEQLSLLHRHPLFAISPCRRTGPMIEAPPHHSLEAQTGRALLGALRRNAAKEGTVAVANDFNQKAFQMVMHGIR